MRNLVNLLKQLKSDESGAAMVEYTVLLALMLVAAIVAITTLGTWVSGRWTALNGALTG